ncbi:hypothetical protein ASA1KI_29900 [Opitutales bacterium ASA1]|nr:hypothetical protein ASA1KI_29900 [Opitutales bacterium ASA1]
MEMAHHDLGIHEILGAAERDQADFDHVLGETRPTDRGRERAWPVRPRVADLLRGLLGAREILEAAEVAFATGAFDVFAMLLAHVVFVSERKSGGMESIAERASSAHLKRHRPDDRDARDESHRSANDGKRID